MAAGIAHGLFLLQVRRIQQHYTGKFPRRSRGNDLTLEAALELINEDELVEGKAFRFEHFDLVQHIGHFAAVDIKAKLFGIILAEFVTALKQTAVYQ